MANDRALRAGEWVEVRTKEEILQTLDKSGQLDSLPFMPQLFNYCGKRLKVASRVHKTCDTVTLTGGRRMVDAVHLEGIRCDGKAYGGCQAGCLIFWKGAWLKRVEASEARPSVSGDAHISTQRTTGSGCTEADVVSGTRKADGDDADPAYVCQITQLPAATTVLPWWNLAQYVEDYTSGNVTLGRLSFGLLYLLYYKVIVSGLGVGAPLRWLYNRIQTLYGGVPYPRATGLVPSGQPTPSATLDLQPGETIRVKSHQEILATLNEHNKNRGLLFDAEMVPHCGRTHRVLARVDQILDERTGKMLKMKRDCIILDGVVCEGRYPDGRYCPAFCRRNIYSYWREIWLTRVAGGQ